MFWLGGLYVHAAPYVQLYEVLSIRKCNVPSGGFHDAAVFRRSLSTCPSFYRWIFFWRLYTGSLLLELLLVTVPGSFYRIEEVGSSTSVSFEYQPVNRLCWVRVLWRFSTRAARDQNISLKFTMTASSQSVQVHRSQSWFRTIRRHRTDVVDTTRLN
jgi:hypothetical protein